MALLYEQWLSFIVKSTNCCNLCNRPLLRYNFVTEAAYEITFRNPYSYIAKQRRRTC